MEIQHLKKFKATFKENINYEISMYQNGRYFVLETEIEKDSQKIKYYNSYDLDSLKENNRFLALCDSIEDIIGTIYDNVSKNNCNIIENQSDYEIKIPVPVKNIREISFILKEQKKSQTEIINDLIKNYLSLKKNIEEHNQKICEQSKKYMNLIKR